MNYTALYNVTRIPRTSFTTDFRRRHSQVYMGSDLPIGLISYIIAYTMHVVYTRCSHIKMLTTLSKMHMSKVLDVCRPIDPMQLVLLIMAIMIIIFVVS